LSHASLSHVQADELERIRFDVIIVGSGVAGGRVAMDLALAGARCLVLEAGGQYSKEDFPLPEVDMLSRLYWNGGLELSRKGSLVFTRGRCVGGGSVVNQALLDRFPEPVLSGWRDQTGLPWFTEKGLQRNYDRAESAMAIRQISEQRFNGNVSRVSEAFDSMGMQWRPLRRAESDACDGQDCMRCLGGCPRESKQSSPVTTLREALRQGACLLSECTVDQVSSSTHGIRVMAVQGGQSRVFEADRIVLAAGAIGTTGILLRSGYRRQLRRLGKNFYCHPQFMTSALVDDIVDAHRGAFQGATADGPGGDLPVFKFETSFVPPIIYHTLFSGWGKGVYREASEYRRRLGIEICIRDTEPGEIRLGRGGHITLRKDLTPADHAARSEAEKMLRDIYDVLGARNPAFSPMAFSVHPMGGCALSNSDHVGVVGPEFRIHGESHMYVADSSLFPSATGRNPSLTVMALANRAADSLITHAGGSAFSPSRELD